MHQIVMTAMFAIGAQATLVSAVVAQGSDSVARYDTDRDSTLDLNETKAGAGYFDKLNKDSDGTLEAQEVKGIIGLKASKAVERTTTEP